MLPLISGNSLSGRIIAPHFGQLYTQVTSSSTSKVDGMNFSRFTTSFVTTLYFVPQSGQQRSSPVSLYSIVSVTSKLERSSSFLPVRFFRLCDGITISSSISAASVSALASASLNRSICSYPSAYFSLEEPKRLLCARARRSESIAFINSSSFCLSFRSCTSVSFFRT